MNRPLIRIALTCAAVGGALTLTSVLRGVDATPDYKKIADSIVTRSTSIAPGDHIVLHGDVRDIPLLEEIAVAAQKRGAETLMIINREEAAKRYFDEVPAKYDSMPLTLSLKLAEAQTVDVSIDAVEHPELFKTVAPERLVATQTRGMDVYKALQKHTVKIVGIGNGLYPTEANARRYGMSKEQLATLFWNGINVDYGRLQAVSMAVRTALTNGKLIHVTNPNGTDLTCRIENRPVFVSDGVISPEDVVKGGPNLQVWLPAGEVYVTPVPGTAEGKLVFDRLPFEDDEIVGLTLTFKGGRVTDYTANAGPAFERWKTIYEKAPMGRDEFATIDIGTNPNVKIPAGSKLVTWVPAGTVSLGIGGNSWAGGQNDISWALGGSINGCTVMVDDATIVENGNLKALSAPEMASR